VGFNPLEDGTFGEGDEARGAKNETYYFGKRELLEFSIVNIPSNRNAQQRAMRDQTAGALRYVFSQLGGKFRMGQIEQMRVTDVLTLLEGKDLDITHTDPETVRKQLNQLQTENNQLKRQIKFLKLK
jgi:hypothetical protein